MPPHTKSIPRLEYKDNLPKLTNEFQKEKAIESKINDIPNKYVVLYSLGIYLKNNKPIIRIGNKSKSLIEKLIFPIFEYPLYLFPNSGTINWDIVIKTIGTNNINIMVLIK